MDNHNQVNKLCGICGNKWVYNDYHRLYKPLKYVLLKIQLDTIKLIEIKYLQDLIFTKRTGIM